MLPGSYPQYYILIISALTLFGTLLKALVEKINVPIHHNFYIIVLASLLGSIMAQFPSCRDFIKLLHLKTDELLELYLPIFIFLTVYSIEMYKLRKCLLELFIVFLSNILVKTFLVTLPEFFLFKKYFTFSMGLLVALTCFPIDPSIIINMFSDVAKDRLVCTLLKTEAVLILVPLELASDLVMGISNGIVINWYQCVCILIRYIVGGVVFGLSFGKITMYAMSAPFEEPIYSVGVCLTILIFTYILTTKLIFVSGTLSILLLSTIVAIEKHNISNLVDTCLLNCLNFLYYIFNIGILMIYSAYVGMYLSVSMKLSPIFYGVAGYFSINLSRFLLCLTVGMFLSKSVRYIKAKQLVVLGFSGITSSLNIIAAIKIRYVIHKFTMPGLSELIIICALSSLLNCMTLKLALRQVGVVELATAPNVNNCLKIIMERRNNTIQTLKTNRHLSNANWSVVRNKTDKKNLFKTYNTQNTEDDSNMIRSTTSATCPKCFTEVPFFITESEMKVMMEEARIRIINAKKMSTVKQYENGAISKYIYQVLQNIFENLTENASKDETFYIKKFFNKFPKHQKNKSKNNQDITEPPRHFHHRRICFYIMMHECYDYIFLTIILLQMAIFISDIVLGQHLIHYIHLLFLFFLGDCIVKVLGHSTSTIKLGIKKYLSDPWNKVDFSMLFLQGATTFISICKPSYNFLNFAFLLFTIIRLIRILVSLMPLIKSIFSKKWRINKKIYLGYELATALLSCYEELIDLLPELISIKAVRDNFQGAIGNVKIAIMKEMELVQMQCPSIAITVKTRQTISSTLKLMEDTLNELQNTGFIDNMESLYILKVIHKKQKALNRLNFVHTNSPKVIFNEVPWMVGNEKIIEFLYNKVETVSWNAGEVICQEGEFSRGIYIVVTGLLKLKYVPNNAVLRRAKKGQIPIIDYISTLQFDESTEDTITSGNTIGELSLLTGRPYDCTIIAESPSQAYLLTFSIIAEAMMLSPSNIDGLEARMWKFAIFQFCLAILMDVHLYQSFTQEQMILKLHRCFVPDLSLYEIFTVTDGMEDIILVEGIAADNADGTVFVAPMLIPKTVQKLLLPSSSFFSNEDIVKTKLVIIATVNINHFEISEEEDDYIEMKLMISSKCLLHLIRDKQAGKRKGGKRKKNLNSVEISSMSVDSSSMMRLNNISQEPLV